LFIMDILHRLRIIFWLLVVGLWGLYLYQYISQDLNSLPKIRLNSNPFKQPGSSKMEKKQIPPDPFQSSQEKPPEPLYQADPAKEVRSSDPKPYQADPSIGNRILVDARMIKDIPETKGSYDEPSGETEAPRKGSEYPETPEGFSMKETKSFVIYEEGPSVSEELVASMEDLHGNIMLDLIAFSPWQREKKAFIYFCNSTSTYQKLTGRPSWSGGAANTAERKIYVYRSEEAMGILAHELTHIYFDSFFGDSNPNPLWLSEGMAVFIQVERANSYPRWLKENLAILKNGGGFKLEDLVRIENLDDADDRSVKLWYAQSYSLVYFMMRMKQGDSFYRFCKNLKDGQYVSRALYGAYGNPYNKLSALEVVWRYDLRTGKLSQINK